MPINTMVKYGFWPLFPFKCPPCPFYVYFVDAGDWRSDLDLQPDQDQVQGQLEGSTYIAGPEEPTFYYH